MTDDDGIISNNDFGLKLRDAQPEDQVLLVRGEGWEAWVRRDGKVYRRVGDRSGRRVRFGPLRPLLLTARQLLGID